MPPIGGGNEELDGKKDDGQRDPAENNFVEQGHGRTIPPAKVGDPHAEPQYTLQCFAETA
jgi:hypothetical protein